MPIQDVAQACGFSSPSVLSRAFKDHFGVSPREFRRQFSSDRLERFRPELRQQFGLEAARSRDSPPPCGEGLGRGNRRTRSFPARGPRLSKSRSVPRWRQCAQDRLAI